MDYWIIVAHSTKEGGWSEGCEADPLRLIDLPAVVRTIQDERFRFVGPGVMLRGPRTPADRWAAVLNREPSSQYVVSVDRGVVPHLTRPMEIASRRALLLDSLPGLGFFSIPDIFPALFVTGRSVIALDTINGQIHDPHNQGIVSIPDYMMMHKNEQLIGLFVVQYLRP